MSASQVDPHDKMRARDVNKVARGEQAPKPAHEFGTVSSPAPPSSTDHITNKVEKYSGTGTGTTPPSADYHTRHCYVRYVDHCRCVEKKGKSAPECEKIATYFRRLCQFQWIKEWDEERARGVFPEEI